MDHLTLQVGILHDIRVDDSDPPDPCCSQVEQKRRAKPTRSDAKDAGRFEAALPLHTDFRKDQMAGIAATLISTQRLRVLHVFECPRPES